MNTDWNTVASWYDEYLKGEDTYQAKVIAPNLLRMIAPATGMKILDVACGEGYFARLCAKEGATVVGIDQAPALLAAAREKASAEESYVEGNAETFATLRLGTFDVVYTVLALENIKDIRSMMEQIASVLGKKGKVILVLLHPSFRIPQHSNWAFSARKNMQYRTVDKYLSEVMIPIELRPFKGAKEQTITFHRSLQWYMKAFRNAGFAISNIEEWISHKTSAPGARQKAEDQARKEFPMFLALELIKL